MTRTTPLTRFLARLLVGLLLAPQAALAAPAGEKVVRGNVDIARDGANTTVRASNRSIIEWTDFDIAAGETVEFVQPNARARVMNRVTGPDSTEIEGALRANGSVYIINPYGITFGSQSIVDVGHLLAAAGHLDDADFAAGVDRFTGLAGQVENLGSIEANTVALLGASVANHGTVTVPNGHIFLLAGDEVIVAEHGSPVVVSVGAPDAAAQNAYAVANTGTLDAGRRGAVRMAAGDLLSLSIHNAGTVRAREIALAGGGRVQVEGVLDASNDVGGPVRDGGAIDIRGESVFVDGALLDASGRRGGGTIHVGGDVQGALAEGSSERNSQLTYVSDDSTLRADALVSGDGGEVVVWSDGAAVIDGAISARGGERSGDGGFVETSGKQWLAVAGAPDVTAPNGNGGEWLLDPANIDIVATSSLGSDVRNLTDDVAKLSTALFVTGTPLILPEAQSSEIEAGALIDALGRGIDVTLSTAFLRTRDERNSTEQGNIRFLTGLDFAAEQIVPETRATLTLRAANSIDVDAAISDASNANLSLTLDFESGDDDQPQLAGSSFADDPLNESIHLNALVDVKGQVLLRGARIEATQDIAALAITADARDAIAVRSLTSDGGIVRLDSANGGISVDGSVATGGQSFIANAVRGDLTVTGDIETRVDPLDAESAGGSVELLATASYELDDRDRPIAPPPMTEALGGNITLGGTTLGAGGGVAIEAGRNLSIANAITTTGGDVALTISDNPETFEIDDVDHAFVTGVQTATISGNITTNGGTVTIRSTPALETDRDIAVDLALSGDIDTRATSPMDPELDGDIAIEISGNVDVAANVDLTARDAISAQGGNVQVSAGVGGAGDLTFGANTTIAAENVAIEAGDGYSRAVLFVDADNDTINDNAEEEAIRSDSLSSQIAFGGLAISATESVSVLQDASIGAGTIGAAALGLASAPSVSIQARDGTLALDASDIAELPSGAGSELVLGAATDIDLQSALDAEKVTIALAEQFSIDQAFADNAAGAQTRELRVVAGTQGAPSDGEILETVTGTLTIEDGVSMRASDTLGQSLALELQGGANGAGHLVVGDNVSLTASEITLRAGDGTGAGTEEQVGGVAVPSEVRFDDTTTLALQGDGSDVRFELRQDADIDATTATALPAVADPGPGFETTYSLRSDDGDITLGDAVVPVLQDTQLVLAANAYDLAGLTAPLRVATLDLGGIASLRVDQALLDAFSFTLDSASETTLRAGVGTLGTLSFASGTVVRGDALVRLAATDGVGGGTGSSVSPTGATFQKVTDATAAPDVFVLEQDAGFTDSKIPSLSSFGDGSGSANATPDLFGLRAIDGAISLAAAPGRLANTKLVLAGQAVVLDVANGDLDLSSATLGQQLEVRADFVTLSAGGSSAANDFSVLPGDAMFFGYDTAEGGLDEGDLDVAGTPDVGVREIVVRQDTDITSANLPMPSGFAPDPDERDATLLSIFAEEDANILLDDETRVAGLDLSIRLFDFDETVARSVLFADGVQFDLHSLDLSVPGALDWSGRAFLLNAVESVRIESGTSGEKVNGVDGDLLFGAGSQITARAVDLIAGAGELVGVDVDSANDLARIDASNLAVTLRVHPSNTDPAPRTSFVFDSDATVDELGITPTTTMTETSFLPMLAELNAGIDSTVFVRARRGNAFLDVADVAFADALDVRAGSSAITGIENSEGGIARIEAVAGDLDLIGGFDTVFVQAREVELAAANRIIASSNVDSERAAVAFRGTIAATPSRMTLEQGAAFDLSAGNDNVVRADQIALPGPATSAFGLDYRLIQHTGSFTVTDVVADQLAGFDLTLDARAGNVTIDASADTTTSPRFFGFHAKTATGQTIGIDAANFRTLAGQSYEGDVRILRDARLSGSQVLFGGTLQGASDGGQSLTIDAVDKVHFAAGVGNDGVATGPTAMNRLQDLTVNFVGGVGELELGSSADLANGQDVFGAGSVATARTDTDSTAIDLAGNLLVRSISAEDFAQDVTTPETRKPVARTATIYQRGAGTLAIRTGGNVSLGDYDPNPATPAKSAVLAAGEKLTVGGTLDIDAVGDVAVGDLTASSIQIDAANLLVLRRAGASVRRSNGSFEADGGVDWVANDFQLATTGAAGSLRQLGRGNPLAIGSSAGRPTLDGAPIDAPLFEINPNGSNLGFGQLFYDADPADLDVAPLVLDGRPAGPSTSNLSEALDETAPQPESRASLATPAIEPDAFAEIGIATRDPRTGELVSRTRASAIFDDASRGWRSDREVARLTAMRLDVHNAGEAKALFEQVFGPGLENAPRLRETLARAVADYRSQSGAGRVLGFELRRYLKNRPSSQFDAYQTLESLDRLFSAHRRTGLVPGEYTPVQRAWVEAITPPGITADELSEAIHPSRYVRGSDVLDVFGS